MKSLNETGCGESQKMGWLSTNISKYLQKVLLVSDMRHGSLGSICLKYKDGETWPWHKQKSLSGRAETLDFGYTIWQTEPGTIWSLQGSKGLHWGFGLFCFFFLSYIFTWRRGWGEKVCISYEYRCPLQTEEGVRLPGTRGSDKMPGITYKQNLCPLQEQVLLTTELPHSC